MGQRLTLGEFVQRRNGVPLGASGSLRNMLRRSLGAGSFVKFWRYWNPIWGYYLGRFVYEPLRRGLPRSLSLVLTFVVSGTVHDLVASAVTRSVVFLLTPWFLVLGFGAVLGEWARVDYSRFSRPVRAGITLAYLGTCLLVALTAMRLVHLD